MRKFIENICGAIEETYKAGDLGLLIVMFLITIFTVIMVGWMAFMELTDWNSKACLAASMFVSLFMLIAFLISMVCYSEE